ncbi:MAG: hypothetical protein R3314_14390 [Longimicrobiales bacterium]|nr:hypothetical protein [Longimicrobiales bacterium]
MSEFETFAVVLSFILGLGVAQILSSVVYLLQARREVRIAWTPLLWAYALLLYHVNFLFALLQAINEALWHLDLLMAALLFLAGGLVLPTAGRPLPDDLIDFFEEHGRIALLPFALFQGLNILYYALSGWPLFGPDGVLNIVLLLLLVPGFWGRGAVKFVTSLVFAGLVTVAFLFLWARPGAI